VREAARTGVRGLVRSAALGKSRGAIVARMAFASIATRGFSVVASLLTVPIVLHHLGAERYGLWTATLALAGLFTIADGGIANSLISHVSRAHGAGDRAAIRVLIGSGLAATAAFGLAFIPLVLIAVHFVNWTWAFNLPDAAMGREAGFVIASICLCYALGLPATVIRQARLGLLQGTAVSLWDLAATIVSVGALVVAVLLGGGITVMAVVWAAVLALARSASAVIFLIGSGRDIRPSWRDVRPAACRVLIASGVVVLLYTLSQAFAVQSDQILIARLSGIKAVTAYAIVQRLFNQPQILMTMFLAAQWPAYGEALGRGDDEWIRRHFIRTLIVLTACAAVACLAIALLCDEILYVWIGSAVVASPALIAAMAVYGVVTAAANTFSFFYLSLRMNRRVVIAQTAMLAIALPVSILLIPRFGSPGAAVGPIVGYLAAIVIPGILMLDRTLASVPAFRGGVFLDIREPASQPVSAGG